MVSAINISDLRLAAKKRLPWMLFDWIDGGAGDERGLRENEAAFEAYRFLPRYMVDVSDRSQRKSVFGRTYDSPFGIAPTGYAGLFRPRADVTLAAAARDHNIPYIMSGTSVDSIEEAAELAPDNVWYQLYGAMDLSITKDIISRAERAGCQALVITIDIPIAGKRERDLRNGFEFPLRITPKVVLDGLLHPAWTLSYLRTGGLPRMANWDHYAPKGCSAVELAEFANSHSFCVQTWDHLRLFRDLWPRHLIVKGVMHPEDAETAVALGADGLIISNHGGRQYDRCVPAPLMISPIRAAVGPNIPVMMDGGIRRGSDVLASLCLGADFVFCGRAMLYGVVAGGATGLNAAIGILRDELDTLMGQIGCLSVDVTGLESFIINWSGGGLEAVTASADKTSNLNPKSGSDNRP
ncbi:alpha-hydroxy-acid oxidizing protein [Mesorhizobium sp. RP14(2022)]|uniref:Alpha-hydroxy-acid oxidizing protein n=1 Tax=Mesorhizobium liriopis TaxID=2953882 RepID=A0ABT1CBM4_9HYPH|nr:alpha-hydroxy acid oxidase [Mesorhizobium liriopis]MCO6052230.1 alpha-hydroxy-acid oxidizing protein [Mesorhizobium liriopis]